jgi:CubicO group peptidase (beta-lactamase class C family)
MARSADLQSTLREALRDLDSSSGPGYVYAAAIEGEVVLEGACGLADVRLAMANTPATRMRIGSTSKEMTAWVVLGLAEDGLLRLDQPVRELVPELHPSPVEPTVLQLLNHTAGTRCHVANAFLQDAGHAVRAPGEAMAALRAQRSLNSEPGTRWIYSNGGYHLLSRIAERVTGLDFPSLMRERLFRPLGMAHTEVLPSDLQTGTSELATLHVATGSGYRQGFFPFEDLLGEGGVVSTARDMLKWLRALRVAPSAREARMQARMTAPTRLADGTELPYGCGLLKLRRFGVEVYMHAGAVMGGSAQAFCVPAHGIDIAVMSNGAVIAPGEVAGRILGELLPASCKSATEAEVVRPRAADHSGLVGRSYQAPSGNVIGFVDQQGLLAVSLFGNPAVPLRQLADRLELAFEDAALGPVRVFGARAGAPHAPETLRVSEGALTETYELQGVASANDLHDLLPGRYACADLETDAVIEPSAGALHMTIESRWGRLVARLEPLSGTALRWTVQDPLMPLAGVMSVRREGHRIVGLQLDTWTSRRLLYQRVGPTPVQERPA